MKNLHQTLTCFLMFFFTHNLSFAVPVAISTNTTWSPGTPADPLYVNGVAISNGATLTITSQNLTNFNSGTSITLASGCKLIISSSQLEAGGGGANTWLGIIATGAGGEQFSTFPTDALNSTVTWAGVLASGQTAVLCTDVDIKFASIGITSTSGAVIRTRGGQFYNCEKGIVIGAYESGIHKEINACYAMGTDFIWDDVISGFNSDDFIGIQLTGVRGVNIGGCNFRNDDATLYCELNRGFGIKTSKADFAVSTEGDRLCDPGMNGCIENCQGGSPGGGCTFENLTYGIYTVGDATMMYDRIGVRKSEFTDNLNGIYIENAQHFVAYQCTLQATRNNFAALYVNFKDNASCDYVTSLPIKFIQTHNSSGVKVGDNDLTFDDTYCEYITVYNSNVRTVKSLIKENDIVNSNGGIDGSDEVLGILSQGNNRGLDIECNTFQNMSNDVYNATGANLKDILKPANSPAPIKHNDNSWSSISGGRLTVYNDGDNLIVHDPNSWALTKGGGSSTTFTYNTQSITCGMDDCDELKEEVGIFDLNLANSVIYPNPVYDKLFVRLHERAERDATISICELNGKNIVFLNLFKDMELSLESLEAGIYFVTIINRGSVYTHKLVKIIQ
jgi:hypothetical protein